MDLSSPDRPKGYIKGYAGYYSRDTHVQVYPSDAAAEGSPIIIEREGLKEVRVYLHPADYYWFRHQTNPALAHKLWEGWLDSHLNKMVDQAMSRIDRPTAGEIREAKETKDKNWKIEYPEFSALLTLNDGSVAAFNTLSEAFAKLTQYVHTPWYKKWWRWTQGRIGIGR